MNDVTLSAGPKPGLYELINAAGHTLENNNGMWYADDAAAVQAIIDGYGLSDARAEITGRIHTLAQRKLADAFTTRSAVEMAGWAPLRVEIKAYNAAPSTAVVPLLSMISAARGADIAVVAAELQVKISHFDTILAQTLGTSGKHRDAVASLTTFADINAYDYTTGW